MSEQVDVVEIKPEFNESDELFSVCKNTNIVDNNSRQTEVTPESKNILEHFLMIKCFFILFNYYIKESLALNKIFFK